MIAAAMATIATVEAPTITRAVSPRVGRRNPMRRTACFRIEEVPTLLVVAERCVQARLAHPKVAADLC